MPRNCPAVNCTSPPPEPPGLMRWDGSLEFGESANLYNYFMWKAKSSSLDHHVAPLRYQDQPLSTRADHMDTSDLQAEKSFTGKNMLFANIQMINCQHLSVT